MELLCVGKIVTKNQEDKVKIIQKSFEYLMSLRPDLVFILNGQIRGVFSLSYIFCTPFARQYLTVVIEHI